jgi:hypothetical protein
MIDYTLAIKSLKSDAQFYLSNVTDLSTLEWKDGNPSNITNKQIEDEWIKVKVNYDGKAYARKRALEYPSVQDFMEAYTEKEIGGDSTKWDAYKTAYNKIRTDNPKE